MSADVVQLVSCLSDTNPAKRAQAAEGLSRLGPQSAPAAVALVRACGDETEEVREYAVAALEEMGSPNIEDIQSLVALLNDPKTDIGYWAATLLGRLESDAASAVPALAAAVTEASEGAVRQRAAWALGRIGLPAAPALSVLNEAAASSDLRLARLAQRAIGQIGG